MLLFDFKDYHEPYSEHNQKHRMALSSTQKISLGASSVHEAHGGTLQTHSFLRKVDELKHNYYS